MRQFDIKKSEKFFSLGVALAAFAAFFFSASPCASAAALSISPAANQEAVGQTFSESVVVNAGSQAINAVSGTISFPPSTLQVVSVSENASIVNFWATQPSYSNVSGTINFEGVVLNPGFSGSAGNVITVTFIAKAEGQSPIKFTDGSVLANDGLGTNVLSAMANASVSVVSSASQAGQASVPSVNPLTPAAPQITSTTNPDPDDWYGNPNPSFSWNVPSDVVAAKVLYDTNPTSVPSVLYTNPISSKTLSAVADGTYYFHVELKNASGWGGISHFRFRIDTVPPSPFAISFPSATSSPTVSAAFAAVDALSGIDHYSVQVDNENPTNVSPAASGLYPLPPEQAGNHTLIVTAFDKAGNSTVATATFSVTGIDAPVITSYTANISQNGIMAVRGSTYPNSIVSIFIRSGGALVDTEKATSDGSGSFTLAVAKSLDSGAYRFTAQVTEPNGSQSGETAPYDFVVGQNPFLEFGQLLINYASIIVVGVLVLAALIGLSWRVIVRLSRLKQEVRKEVGQAEGILHRSFDLLKEDISDHARLLVKAKTKRKLTAEEDLFLKKFGGDLKAAENVISKEIKNLDDLK